MSNTFYNHNTMRLEINNNGETCPKNPQYTHVEAKQYATQRLKKSKRK